jgi:hypothetical protein
MPVSPTPGRGISVSGLDKTQGFKTPADEGINHIAGLSESGLDTATNPLTIPLAPTGVAATGAVINWTTAPSSPPGSVVFRLAGSGAAYSAPVTEGAGNKTAHTVPLTGLTAAKGYEYVVTQPSPIANSPAVQFKGRFTTAAALAGTTQVEQTDASRRPGIQVPPAFRDTTQVHDSQDLIERRFAQAQPEEQVAVAPPLQTAAEAGVPPQEPEDVPGDKATEAPWSVTDLEVDELEPNRAVVLWRTSVYADGTAMVRGGDDDPVTLEEPGAKRRNHAVILEDLTPDTHYEIAVISADAEGRTAEGGPIGFNTPPE